MTPKFLTTPVRPQNRPGLPNYAPIFQIVLNAKEGLVAKNNQYKMEQDNGDGNYYLTQFTAFNLPSGYLDKR